MVRVWVRDITILNKYLELLNVVTNNFIGLQRSDRLSCCGV